MRHAITTTVHIHMSIYWIKRIDLVVAQFLKLLLPSPPDSFLQLVINNNMFISILLIFFQFFTLYIEPLWIGGIGLIIKGVPSKLGIDSFDVFFWILRQLFERHFG
eukprot:366072_1